MVDAGTVAVATQMIGDAGLKAIGAGIAITGTGLASGWAEKEIGSAAIGAMAENEALFGKGLDPYCHSRNHRYLRSCRGTAYKVIIK